MREILQQTFLGNSVENYCWFAGLILAGLLLKSLVSKVFSYVLFRFIKKYSSGVGSEKLFYLLKKPIEISVLLIFLYFAFNRLRFPSEWQIVPREYFGLRMFIQRTFSFALTCSFTWIVLRLTDFFGLTLFYKASQSKSGANKQLVYFLKETVKVVILVISLFFILGNVFKLDIVSLIAGLGIGGLAVALAAKESIENLLGSFTIFFDKPFVTGDYIKTGNIEGKIEKIGFRSTRIETPEKSFITVPNKKLVESALDNFSLRTENKVQFTLSLDYKTTCEIIQRILEDIKKAVDGHPAINAAENNITLYDLGPNSFNIQVIYFVKGNDNRTYLRTRQEINLNIIAVVNKHGAGFYFQ
jgi:MscS family membrane protein